MKTRSKDRQNDAKQKLMNAGGKVANAGGKVMNGLSHEIRNLPNKETTNYKTAAAASAMFGVGMLISKAAGDSVSFYFDMLAASASLGVALNQSGMLDSVKPVVSSTYASLFGNSSAEKAVEAEQRADLSSSGEMSPALGR